VNVQSSNSASIDWSQVHERLANAVSEVRETSPEAMLAVLDERTKALAQLPELAERSHRKLAFVVLTLARDVYALDVRYVRQVIRSTYLMPVPGLPEFFLGVTILRGRILPAIDLFKFFRLPHVEAAEASHLLVVGQEHDELALGVEDVSEVVELDEDDFAPPEQAGPNRKYVRGVNTDALIMLDGAALLNDVLRELRNGET
jgi:purine-binding chemotaxis protein CheW